MKWWDLLRIGIDEDGFSLWYTGHMRFSVLASGSKGNATYVEVGGVRLLIDAGLACRTLAQRLSGIGVSPEGLDGILVTHEHTDHVSGLDRFATRYNVPVYANEGTAAVVERQCRLAGRTPPEFVIFESRIPFALGDVVITPVRISHDTAEPVAYTLDDGTHRLGYFTDLGFVSRDVAEAVRSCSALVLESNHDLGMLRASGRPFSLISRIRGEVGHLSNEQACEAIRALCSEDLCTLVLAHLSHDCNDSTLAREMMCRTLRDIGRTDLAAQVQVAKQECPLPFIEL